MAKKYITISKRFSHINMAEKQYNQISESEVTPADQMEIEEHLAKMNLKIIWA